MRQQFRIMHAAWLGVICGQTQRDYASLGKLRAQSEADQQKAAAG